MPVGKITPLDEYITGGGMTGPTSTSQAAYLEARVGSLFAENASQRQIIEERDQEIERLLERLSVYEAPPVGKG